MGQDAMKVLGILATPPTDSTAFVNPAVDMGDFRAGMLLQFVLGDHVRPGYAEVKSVNHDDRSITFERPLNVLVPHVAWGDGVIEYALPCTRCRCRQCVARAPEETVPYSRQMADPIDVSKTLRSEGATKVAFHPNGALASVEFGPVASDGEPQHEASDAPAPRVNTPVGRLVPRVDRDQ